MNIEYRNHKKWAPKIQIYICTDFKPQNFGEQKTLIEHFRAFKNVWPSFSIVLLL